MSRYGVVGQDGRSDSRRGRLRSEAIVGLTTHGPQTERDFDGLLKEFEQWEEQLDAGIMKGEGVAGVTRPAVRSAANNAETIVVRISSATIKRRLSLISASARPAARTGNWQAHRCLHQRYHQGVSVEHHHQPASGSVVHPGANVRDDGRYPEGREVWGAGRDSTATLTPGMAPCVDLIVFPRGGSCTFSHTKSRPMLPQLNEPPLPQISSFRVSTHSYGMARCSLRDSIW
jgi:hypothetical protein